MKSLMKTLKISEMNSQLVFVFSASSKSKELHPFPTIQNLSPILNILLPHLHLPKNVKKECLHL